MHFSEIVPHVLEFPITPDIAQKNFQYLGFCNTME